MATILRSNGSTLAVDTPTLSLDDMQEAVGGFFEIVFLSPPTRHNARAALVVNEEGLRLDLPLNERATRLYRGTPPRHDGIIVGDVILVTVIDAGLDTERIV